MDFFELITNSEVTFANAVLKLILALLLGALIGLERKRKGQIAGMRTFALITMGATLAMLVSIYIPQEYMGLKNGDPGRIAAQVVSGIGFLGAGAIIQSKGSVRGLTTAASIWISPMIGLAVGAGMYAVSVIAALLIVFVLFLLEKYEHLLHLGQESKIVRIKLGSLERDLTPYKELFSKHNVHISDEYLRYDYTQEITIINFMILIKADTNFEVLFEQLYALSEYTHSITLSNELNN